MMDTDLIAFAFDIVITFGPAVLNAAQKNERIVAALNKLGLKPDAPSRDFASCYTFALVEYAADGDKSLVVLGFFRNHDVQKAFQEAFEEPQTQALGSILEWNKVGDALRDADVNIHPEIAQFWEIFKKQVIRSAEPIDVLNYLIFAQIGLHFIAERRHEKC